MPQHECMHEQDFRELYCKINETHTMVKLIDQSIRGNGQPGIIKRLDNLESNVSLFQAAYNKAQGAYWVVCFLGGGGFLAGLAACIKIFSGG